MGSSIRKTALRAWQIQADSIYLPDQEEVEEMSAIGLDSILANQGMVNTGKTTQSTSDMGKDTFLKLLVTQLQYQDPMNPVENTEFTAQLAQFSSLEALTDMNESMDQLSYLQGSVNNIQSLSFIGKQVSAKGNIIHYTGEDVGIDFNLDGNASDVRVKIYTPDGTLVRTIEIGEAAQGDVECLWNGTDSSGEQVGQGRYTFAVEAIDYDGLPVTSESYTMGEVTGVRYDDGVTYLIIGDKEVTISDVEKILG
jgi:flagellar basal-body rod modification protein FlgD